MEVSGEDPAVINKAVSADLAEVTLCEDPQVWRQLCGQQRGEWSGRGRAKVEPPATARACRVLGSARVPGALRVKAGSGDAPRRRARRGTREGPRARGRALLSF